MISKKEWHAALRRVLQRMSLLAAGVFMMAAMFYWLVWSMPLDAAIMAVTSIVLIGYGFT